MKNYLQSFIQRCLSSTNTNILMKLIRRKLISYPYTFNNIKHDVKICQIKFVDYFFFYKILAVMRSLQKQIKQKKVNNNTINIIVLSTKLN